MIILQTSKVSLSIILQSSYDYNLTKILRSSYVSLSILLCLSSNLLMYRLQSSYDSLEKIILWSSKTCQFTITLRLTSYGHLMFSCNRLKFLSQSSCNFIRIIIWISSYNHLMNIILQSSYDCHLKTVILKLSSMFLLQSYNVSLAIKNYLMTI